MGRRSGFDINLGPSVGPDDLIVEALVVSEA